ncbi:IMPACT family protein [Oenococcus sicerae]|uniref:YigZ family protein n=1 Tax=Oenococcus sicerae TaxID=2203724 RepID=A0AAJ1RAS5_9LACO|nr:YigZ family protein [Oenococcus sicerae]MDN6900901.1 YigZ family protein [Oenococcus sicerae]
MTQTITIKRHFQETFIVKKSRFIADIWPIQDERQAKTTIQTNRQLHTDANHVAFAYTIGLQREIQRMSDNGEPSGTAGKPILDAILKNELVNVLITVTRYFGGIKLGAGGLIRSYSQSASQVVNRADLAFLTSFDIIQAVFDYAMIDQFNYFAKIHNIKVTNMMYAGQIQADCYLLTSRSPELQQLLINSFAGKIDLKQTGKILLPILTKENDQ